MRGRMQAMAVAASFALLSLLMPPISIVSSATLALVTLRRGGYEGILVLLSASLAAAILGFFVLGNFQFALGYTLILWLPVWVLSVVLREGRHLSLAFEMASVLGVLFVAGFYLMVENPAMFWLEVLNIMLQPMLQVSEVPVEQIEQTVVMLAKYMMGILATGSVTGLLLGLLLARWWQSNLYNRGGFAAEYLSLRMPQRFTIMTLVILLVASVTTGVFSELVWNIGIILFMLYAFIGTAIAHALIATFKAKRFILPLFYISIFVVPQIVLPVAIIGISDTWLNLRKNITPPSST
ncbi:hypothetical protein BJAS_P1908 [Bathymodiolus japonicus methanotrophic gill symbiont]|nr:hypothetical protein BJAS_P1908 [Bathymodiolus japonicus methanotrophic gill symbiont]